MRRVLGVSLGLFLIGGCAADSSAPSEDGAVLAEGVIGEDASAPADSGSPTVTVPPNASARFAEGVMPAALHMGGYIDSIFINKAGDRVYFVHSMVSPSVIDGQATQEECSHTQGPLLEGHITIPGLEWNTDLYYVAWDGAEWSEPINLGEPINSLGMECCVWLNEDETEIIFYTKTDLDDDGRDGDVGLRPTGNYRATRPNRDAAWSAPKPLPGVYGIENQLDDERHDVHKAPSGNLYLWEKYSQGDMRLRYGERIGGSYDEPVYAKPTTIKGSVNYETQIWVNDEETRLIFNRRQFSGETEAFTRTRATTGDPWGEPTLIQTTGFSDANGNAIWGEPTFDQSQSFMLFIRFNSSDPTCMTSEVMYSAGHVESGFAAPIVLN